MCQNDNLWVYLYVVGCSVGGVCGSCGSGVCGCSCCCLCGTTIWVTLESMQVNDLVPLFFSLSVIGGCCSDYNGGM